MTFNPDDPKYTAYVLNELNDSDRASVEAELQANPQAAALVAEIRATTGRLLQTLKTEPLPALTEVQREAVLAVAPHVGSQSRRLVWAAAMAASLLLAVGAGWLLRGLATTGGDRQMAAQTQSDNDLGLIVSQTREVNSDEAAVRRPAEPTAQKNMKQVGLGMANYEDKRSGAPPSYGGVAPSAVVGLDPIGNPASIADPQHSIQFRREGINAAPRPSDGPAMSSLNGARSIANTKVPAVANPVPADVTGFYFSAGVNGTIGTQGLSNSGSDVAVQRGDNKYAGGTVLNTGTLNLAGNSAGATRKRWGSVDLNAAAAATGNSTVAAPVPGLATAEGVVDESRQLITLKKGTSPDAMKAALMAVMGGQQQQQRGWGDGEHNTEAYDYLVDNPYLAAVDNLLSTFSIDVDTASYSNVRRFLMQQNQLPPPGAVRIEELINYFRYDYPQPEGERPFSLTTEVASCPWQAEHRLVRIGLKGREIPADKRPPTSLVFLIDVSGSMEEPNKLPLVQQSLKLLAEQLGENDKVAIVVYAGTSGLVLPSTRGDKRHEIIDAIERLRAGGSTNGGEGIQLAYEIASQSFIKGGVNRVILATDGDFNVGITNQDALIRLIQDKAKTGVFLTTLGFGYGNVKDSTMQKLADKGNGNNYYIDDLPEARKVLVEQIGGTLVTIAKDVKIQVEFNPLEVAGYRLIGYEKRMLAKEDFNNDKIDAGEIGAGHTVTALYEIVPVNREAAGLAPRSQESGVRSQESDAKAEGGRQSAEVAPTVDPLRYVKPAELTDVAKSGELFTLKLRYKQPDGEKSTLLETPVKDAGKKYGEASADFKFAAAVASFGMILRDSPYKGNATLAAVQELAQEGLVREKTADGKQQADSGYRAEFVQLVGQAKNLKGP